MLLQTSTANGGSSSRSMLYQNTIAVAIEMARDQTLNFTASCIRHGVRMADYGKDGGAVHERVAACRDRIAELGLLERDLSRPIDRRLVDEVRSRLNVSVADAAAAVHATGNVDAACESVRERLAGTGHICTRQEAVTKPRSRAEHELMVRLQPLLRLKNVSPSLKTIGVALAMCREPSLDVDACCIAHGIPQQGKVALDRVASVRDRILALGVLSKLEAEIAAEEEGKVAGSSSDTASEAVGSAGGGAEGGFVTTETAHGGAAAADALVVEALPEEEQVWLSRMRERIGFRKPAVHGGKICLPSVETVAAAVEVCRTNQYDLDFDDLQRRFGIKVTWSHMWDVADRIKRLGLLEVGREALGVEPNEHDPTLLRSLQLRLYWHPPPNLDNLAVALDLHLDASLDLVTCGVWRRLDVGRIGGLHRQKAIERLREGLRKLEPPLNSYVDDTAVEKVRAFVKRSGMSIPKVAVAANAIAKFGVSDPVGACNAIRAAEGLPPIEDAEASREDAEDEDDAKGGERGTPTREQPPPISDELLAELQRRVATRLKRHLHLLPAEKYFRAAADLCTPDVRDSHWRYIVDKDVVAVCSWHGIQLSGPGRREHLDRLRELRNHFRDFGPLEQLEEMLSARKQPQSAVDTTLYANLQLLLQTPTAMGGSASRPALALNTIGVAVAMCREPSLDVDACCIAHGICPTNRQTHERVSSVRDRIAELGLLERDLSRPIDRRLVDEVRSRLNVSVADAAAAVAKHGRNLRAACAEVGKQVELRGGDVARAELPTAVDGVKLYLSDRSPTGYLGVRKSQSGKFYECWGRLGSGAREGQGTRAAEARLTKIGTFDTAVAAAAAYAKHRATLPEGLAHADDDDAEGDANGGLTPDARGESGCHRRRQEPAEPAGLAREILRDNGESGLRQARRWLVRVHGQGDEVEEWVGYERMPAALLEEYEGAQQVAFNNSLEPSLKPGSEHSSGVYPCSVPVAAAERCADFLHANWSDGQLALGSAQKVWGWASYSKTLSAHDAENQRQNTLLFTHELLPSVQENMPGFAEIGASLTTWLNGWCAQRGRLPVELFYAHGLRQSPQTLSSTGFAVHQDTEDFDFIEYSIVVKLTADGPGEAPSRMRVVGADRYFEYGAAAGSSGLFLARLHHASVAPISRKEHLKIAFFFRSSSSAAGSVAAIEGTS
jgi:uncharacterized protein YlxP (DUF503 family)